MHMSKSQDGFQFNRTIEEYSASYVFWLIAPPYSIVGHLRESMRIMPNEYAWTPKPTGPTTTDLHSISRAHRHTTEPIDGELDGVLDLLTSREGTDC